ncbi:hypothetical protein EJ110_NYTH42411 [Nymphaea thermarum]|nr:hypothetical protein EJ110_NYTH42411 [Nymphaea thermarum]
MSWIMSSVQPQIASTIAYYTSTKQMWDFLKQTYSNDKNVSKILQVEEELLNLQHGDQSLAQYFASLKSIHERLKALCPPCPTCHKTHGEQSMVAKFLQGLSPEYAIAKAQMLTGAEIPDLTEAYNRLSRLVVTLSQPSNDIQASALVASGGRGRSSFRGRGIGRGSGGDGSLSPSHPEIVTVSINKSEYEDFPAHRSIQPSASTVMIDSAMSVDTVPHDTGSPPAIKGKKGEELYNNEATKMENYNTHQYPIHNSQPQYRYRHPNCSSILASPAEMPPPVESYLWVGAKGCRQAPMTELMHLVCVMECVD